MFVIICFEIQREGWSDRGGKLRESIKAIDIMSFDQLSLSSNIFCICQLCVQRY